MHKHCKVCTWKLKKYSVHTFIHQLKTQKLYLFFFNIIMQVCRNCQVLSEQTYAVVLELGSPSQFLGVLSMPAVCGWLKSPHN